MHKIYVCLVNVNANKNGTVGPKFGLSPASPHLLID